MKLQRWALVAALACAAGLTACSDRYGYGGVAAGYGYYDGGYGYGYPSYFGWYDDFYYPGSGVYVYDRYRRPFRWNDTQRRYWQGRRDGYHGNGNGRGNWNGFAQRPGGPGFGNRYQGRRAFDGSSSLGVTQDGTVGTRGYRDGRDRAAGGGRSYGGRWRNPSTPAPTTGAPSNLPPAAAAPRGGGRSWGGGGWRGGRGRR